ncbi:MAG: hypothetical protein AAB692_03200, partial [Patescibacteria group bacterium]
KTSDLSAMLALKAKYDPHSGTIKLPLNEVDLTTLLSQAVASPNAQSSLPIKDIQIAIEPEYVEVFADIERQGGLSAVRFRFLPIIRNGVLDLDAKEVVLGSLTLPEGMARGLVTFAGKGLLDAIRTGISEVGAIEEIALESKMLRVTLKPSKR